MKGRGTIAAYDLREECGIHDPFQLPLEIIISSKNIICKEEEIDGADGRILMSKDSAIITINSKIEIKTKKRFVLAHELGHFLLHRDKTRIYNDNDETLNYWYQENFDTEETEANEFAAEFLMPSELFHQECKDKVFGPEVIDHLSEKFQVSKTATILRFVEQGNYPVCIVYCSDNKMKWWKKSKDFKNYLQFEHNEPPPSGSVVSELFATGKSYFGDDRKQGIWKSIWFQLKPYEEEKIIYEFCLNAISYNYTLSVIWED